MIDKIISFFLDPFWWITVGASTIVLNIISGWVGLGLSKSKTALFRRWSDRSERHREFRRRRVEFLKTDSAGFQYYIHLANTYYHTATVHFVTGSLGLIVLTLVSLKATPPLLLLYPSALLFTFMGVLATRNLYRASEISRDLHACFETSETNSPDQTPSDNA